MKSNIIIILFVIGISACRTYKINDSCKNEQVHKLKELAKAISFNKTTKIYTLHHSKLPDITPDRFMQLRDSLENVTSFLHDINMVKHFLYCKELELLTNGNCQIGLHDIRKYYGIEFTQGTKDGKVHTLFYYFNNFANHDCFDKVDHNSGKERKCSSFSFQFNENGILTNVNTEFFGY